MCDAMPKLSLALDGLRSPPEQSRFPKSCRGSRIVTPSSSYTPLSVRGSRLMHWFPPEAHSKIERLQQIREEARQLELELLENVGVRRQSRHGQSGEQSEHADTSPDTSIAIPNFVGQVRALKPPAAVERASTAYDVRRARQSTSSTDNTCFAALDKLEISPARSAPGRMQSLPQSRYTSAGRHRLTKKLIKDQIYDKHADPQLAAYSNLDTLRQQFQKACPSGTINQAELLDVMKKSSITMVPQQASNFFAMLGADDDGRITYEDFLRIFYLPTYPGKGFMDGEKASTGRPRTGHVWLALLSTPLSVTSNRVPSYPNAEGQLSFTDALHKPWATPANKRPPRGSWGCRVDGRLHTAPALRSSSRPLISRHFLGTQSDSRSSG